MEPITVHTRAPYVPTKHTYALYGTSLRRPLAITQELLYLLIPNYLNSYGQAPRSADMQRWYPQPGQENQELPPGSLPAFTPLAQFLYHICLQVTPDVLLSEAFFHESVERDLCEHASIQDFCLELQARLFAAWHPDHTELSNAAQALVIGYRRPEERRKPIATNTAASFNQAIEAGIVPTTPAWQLPEQIRVRWPDEEALRPQLETNRFMMTMALMNMVGMDRYYLKDLV